MAGATTRQLAFDTIERLQTCRTTVDVIAMLGGAGASFGFENFTISGLPLPAERVDPYIMACAWPDEWADRYKAKDYIHIDPVIRQVRQASMPFMWSEAPYDTTDAVVGNMMGEAAELGLVEGFAVPIYTVHGFQAIVTFGARSWAMSPDEKAALHLVGIYAHSAARACLPRVGTELNNDRPRLSARETEVLKWSAAGKTAWEISMILRISQRTAEQYLESAAHKLRATNKVHAVAEALRHQLIN